MRLLHREYDLDSVRCATAPSAADPISESQQRYRTMLEEFNKLYNANLHLTRKDGFLSSLLSAFLGELTVAANTAEHSAKLRADIDERHRRLVTRISSMLEEHRLKSSSQSTSSTCPNTPVVCLQESVLAGNLTYSSNPTSLQNYYHKIARALTPPECHFDADVFVTLEAQAIDEALRKVAFEIVRPREIHGSQSMVHFGHLPASVAAGLKLNDKAELTVLSTELLFRRQHMLRNAPNVLPLPRIVRAVAIAAVNMSEDVYGGVAAVDCAVRRSAEFSEISSSISRSTPVTIGTSTHVSILDTLTLLYCSKHQCANDVSTGSVFAWAVSLQTELDRAL